MIFLLSFILAVGSDWLEACMIQEFVEVRDKRYPDSVTLTAEPILRQDCVRSCRLYLDCFAFSVQWTGVSSELGLCMLLSGVMKDTDLVDQNGTTTYLSCPDDMAYNLKSHTCRSRNHQPRDTWYEATKLCGIFYPGTHILEIRTAADLAYLRQVSAGKNVWLGMFRPAGAEKDDFRYVSDNSSLTYTNWHGTQPDQKPTKAGSPADCVASYDKFDQGHLWYDAPCGSSSNEFICEL
ncbi:hypothetical protein LSH36_3429g00001 [Paralvinella palmiformis]|uniref:C-type lectin domain-containing protein n=1 Tax=Paralvinella palmiformis TaxID=53620 RepID=A0AAD9IP82_9ANNE|nr:hypothetical protein LSH36_3429g00001 [Paralvinella palmiformis]